VTVVSPVISGRASSLLIGSPRAAGTALPSIADLLYSRPP